MKGSDVEGMHFFYKGVSFESNLIFWSCREHWISFLKASSFS